MAEFKSIEEALLDLQSASQRTLEKDAKNPHFKNRYVTLEKLLEEVTPLLNERKIVLIQSPTSIMYGPEISLGLETQLLHVPSSTSQTFVMPLNKLQRDDPQGQGSAITYARRYMLMSILGLVGEEDDDGNAARGEKPSTVKKKSEAKPKKKTAADVKEDDEIPY